MITCPICNKNFQLLSFRHLLCKHNMIASEFRKLYPTYIYASEEYKKSMSQKKIEFGNNQDQKKKEEYYQNPKKCFTCGKPLTYERKKQGLFTCGTHAKSTHHTKETKDKISNSLKNSKIFKERNLEGKYSVISYHTCNICNNSFITRECDGLRKTCGKLECLKKQVEIDGINIRNYKNHQHFKITKDQKDIYLESSFEIKLAKNLDDNQIKWIQPQPLSYIDLFKQRHLYYADFYLPEYNIYIDPKNSYLLNKSIKKLIRVSKQNNIKLLIISNEKLLNWENIKEKINIQKNIIIIK